MPTATAAAEPVQGGSTSQRRKSRWGPPTLDGAEGAVSRDKKRPKLECMDCGKKKCLKTCSWAHPMHRFPTEHKKRWCEQKNPEAGQNRGEVFQWARSQFPGRCAYWILAECPNLKAGKTCDHIHECAQHPSSVAELFR